MEYRQLVILSKMNFEGIKKYIQQCSDIIENEIEKHLSLNHCNPKISIIKEAMQYSAMGGKKLRPFLLIAIADMLNVPRSMSIQYGVVIEMIHSYSLVHDDLPALDNDDVRRNKPSCHKKFSEGIAILTGDALLTESFKIASNIPNSKSDKAIQIISKIATAISTQGMIGGQVIDIITKNNELSEAEFHEMQTMKTGKLFSLCFEIPEILSETTISNTEKSKIQMYVKSIGSAFQIIDDINDYEKDKKNGIPNIAVKTGIDVAKDEVNILITQAIELISSIDRKTSVLKEFARYIHSKIE